MSVINMYEKMMKEGKLNKPIHIQQITPENPNGSQFGSDIGNNNYLQENCTMNSNMSDIHSR